jgi:flagellar biogenesis protein FliO
MDAQAPAIPSLGGSLALTFLSLGLVCLLAYVSLRWVSRRGIGQPTGPIRVLARCSPEPKRSLFLIEAAGRCFLVGASDGGMNLLAELDPKDVKVEEPAATRFARATRGRFGELLARVLARPAAGTGAVAGSSRTAAALPSPGETEHEG